MGQTVRAPLQMHVHLQTGCGTLGGYKAHLRRGEPSCPECLAANRKYNNDRNWRTGKHRSRDEWLAAGRTPPSLRLVRKARRAALARLRDVHRAEYDALYAEEIAAADLNVRTRRHERNANPNDQP